MAFNALSDYLIKASAKYKLSGAVRAASVCNSVNDCLSEHFPLLAKGVTAKKFKDGVVHVSVSGSSARALLRMQQSEVLWKLHALGHHSIKEILVER